MNSTRMVKHKESFEKLENKEPVKISKLVSRMKRYEERRKQGQGQGNGQENLQLGLKTETAEEHIQI